MDFAIPKGGAASFIGESGCGKTTLGRIIAGLETYDAGEIAIDGTPMSPLKLKQRQPHFRKIQLIHQDPYSALNPTRTIDQTLHAPAEPAGQADRPVAGVDRASGAAELLELVGLDAGTCCPATRTSSPAGCASGSSSPAR